MNVIKRLSPCLVPLLLSGSPAFAGVTPGQAAEISCTLTGPGFAARGTQTETEIFSCVYGSCTDTHTVGFFWLSTKTEKSSSAAPSITIHSVGEPVTVPGDARSQVSIAYTAAADFYDYTGDGRDQVKDDVLNRENTSLASQALVGTLGQFFSGLSRTVLVGQITPAGEVSQVAATLRCLAH